ncbi:MAG: hypothetical protein GKR96_11745 [Gammaproteobacteria bacterium]|nr:hypothetical protein [Gammaproteobacteria bacterium]
MRIAAVQLNASDDVNGNLSQVDDYIRLAAAEKCKAVFLPECFGLMQSSRAQLFELAEEDGAGPIQRFLALASARYGIWIFAGSLPFRTNKPDQVTNTALVFDENGNRVARYDKIHLFDVILSEDEKYLESSYVEV